MVQTKTKRKHKKQKKHKKHGKTKKIYGGGVLFDYSIWASTTISPGERTEALIRINNIVPNPKHPIKTGRLIKTALAELREKLYDDYAVVIYDALDSKIYELISKKSVDLKDIFDAENKGDLINRLPKTNKYVETGDVEMTELSSRPLMDIKTKQPTDAQRVSTPTLGELGATDIGGDLSAPGLNDQKKNAVYNKNRKDLLVGELNTNFEYNKTLKNRKDLVSKLNDRNKNARASDIPPPPPIDRNFDKSMIEPPLVPDSEEASKKADKLVSESKRLLEQTRLLMEQSEAAELFEDVSGSLVEIIGAAEEQVAASKAKSALDLFNVVNKDLQTMVDTVELELKRDAAEKARQIEIQNAETEAGRIAAEQRFAAEKAKIDAIALFSTVNGHLQTMVETVETEEERNRLAAVEKEAELKRAVEEEERKRAAAEKVEAEQILAAAAAAERIVAAEKAAAEQIATDKAKSDAVSLFGTVNEHLQNMTDVAENEQKRIVAAEEAQRLAVDEEAARKRVDDENAAKKLEEERKRVDDEEADKERILAEKADKERILAEKADKERILAEKADKERILAEEAETDRKLKRAAAESLFDSANQSLGDIIGAAEEEERNRISDEKAKEERILGEKAKSDAVRLFGTVNGHLQNMTDVAENEQKRIAVYEEAARKRAAETLFINVNKSLESIAAEAEAEVKRIADEAAAARLVEEAEAEVKRKTEAEVQRIADEAEVNRKTEAEVNRKAETEAEVKRIADEAEAKRIAARSLLNVTQKSLGEITDKAETEHDRITREKTARLESEAEDLKRAAAKSLLDAANQSLDGIVGTAELENEAKRADEKEEAERIVADEKADEERERAAAEELERISAKKVEEERAVAESLLNKANKSLEEIITIAERDAAAANLASERPSEETAAASSQSLNEVVIKKMKEAEEGINRMVDSFYKRVDAFDYTNLDCENYYELLLYANKAPNNMERTLRLLEKLLPKTDGIITQIEKNMMSIKKAIDSIYLISPLYQKDKNVDESLTYYTDTKMKQVKRNLDENIKNCLDNSIIDIERVTEVARLARDKSPSTLSLNQYIEKWLVDNGNPNTQPIQLRLPDDIKKRMPELGTVNPIGSDINKLYVLRTVEELVTIDPLSIYAYEKSILDDQNTIAIIPDYMVNSDDGEITATELQDLLQLYVEIYQRMSKELTNQESITKFEGTYNSDEALLGYFTTNVSQTPA